MQAPAATQDPLLAAAAPGGPGGVRPAGRVWARAHGPYRCGPVWFFLKVSMGMTVGMVGKARNGPGVTVTTIMTVKSVLTFKGWSNAAYSH